MVFIIVTSISLMKKTLECSLLAWALETLGLVLDVATFYSSCLASSYTCSGAETGKNL